MLASQCTVSCFTVLVGDWIRRREAARKRRAVPRHAPAGAEQDEEAQMQAALAMSLMEAKFDAMREEMRAQQDQLVSLLAQVGNSSPDSPKGPCDSDSAAVSVDLTSSVGSTVSQEALYSPKE